MDIIWPNNLHTIPISLPYNIFGGNIAVYALDGSGTTPVPPVPQAADIPELVGIGSGSTSGLNVTNFFVPVPAHSEGDYLITTITNVDAGLGITAPTGWDAVDGLTDQSIGLRVYGKYADASEPEYYEFAFSGNEDDAIWQMSAFSGVHPTIPIVTDSITNSPSGEYSNGSTAQTTFIGIPSITTTYDNQLHVALLKHDSKQVYDPAKPSPISSGVDHMYPIYEDAGNLLISSTMTTKRYNNIGRKAARTIMRGNVSTTTSVISFLLNPRELTEYSKIQDNIFIVDANTYGKISTPANNIRLPKNIDADDMLVCLVSRDGTPHTTYDITDNLGASWQPFCTQPIVGSVIHAWYKKAVGTEERINYTTQAAENFNMTNLVIRHADTTDFIIASGKSIGSAYSYGINSARLFPNPYPTNDENNTLFVNIWATDVKASFDSNEGWTSFGAADMSGIGLSAAQNNAHSVSYKHQSGIALPTQDRSYSVYDGAVRASTYMSNTLFQFRGANTMPEMPAPFIKQSASHAFPNSQSMSLIMPTGQVRDGNVYIAIITDNSASAELTAPDGWSRIHSETYVGNAVHVYWKIAENKNGTDETGYSYTWESDTIADFGATILEIEETSRTMPVGRIRVHADASTTPTVPEITPSHNYSTQVNYLLAMERYQLVDLLLVDGKHIHYSS